MTVRRPGVGRLFATGLLGVLLVSAAFVGVAATPGDDGDYAVTGDREGGVDPGREDDEQQTFPINFTFFPVDHSPGVTGGSFEVYASGLSEKITGHDVVLQTTDFGLSSCTASDASAFGIDRGNDGSGTATDVSLLTAYKTYTSNDTGIYIGFYEQEALAGGPINATVDDQVVARQNNCVSNPTDPGWYRARGFITGSTKYDTNTDYRIWATSQYTYVCDCESRQQARETLGPPPNEQGGDGNGGSGGAESSGDGGSGGSPTPTTEATATPEPDGGSTPTAAGGDTPTSRASSATATADGPQNDPGGPDPPASTPSATGSSRQGTAATARRTPLGNGTSLVTPTIAEGPGFGALAALGALLALVLSVVGVVRRE